MQAPRAVRVYGLSELLLRYVTVTLRLRNYVTLRCAWTHYGLCHKPSRHEPGFGKFYAIYATYLDLSPPVFAAATCGCAIRQRGVG